MNDKRLPAKLIAVAAVLMLSSLLWPKLVGGRRAYTETDAINYQKASADLHDKLHAHQGHAHDDHSHDNNKSASSADADAVLQAAKDQFNQAVAKRDSAVTRGQTTAAVMKWLAILAAASGVIVYLVQRIRDSKYD
jgi:hypothetical protein